MFVIYEHFLTFVTDNVGKKKPTYDESKKEADRWTASKPGRHAEIIQTLADSSTRSIYKTAPAGV